MNRDLDPRLREKLMDYNRPPEVPRERIWEAIQARRGRGAAGSGEEQQRRVRIHRLRRLAWPVAAAALLVLGIALGRVSKEGAPDLPPVSTGPSVESTGTQPDFYTVAADRYLGRAEILLIRYRSSDPADRDLADYQMRARRLLLETRLLLDSPAGEDPDTQRLLEELELVLARMSRVGSERGGESRLLDKSLDSGTLMMRLKTRKPAAILPNQV